MINGQEFLDAIYSIANEKRIDESIIFEGVSEGFQKAYEKFFDPDAIVKVEIDKAAGQISVFKELTVVQKVEDDLLEIGLSEAKAKYGEETTIGDKVYEPVVFSDEFSRLAIIHVGQIIKQKIREGEKQKIFEEFSDKEHKMVYGEIKEVTETSYLVSVDGSIIPIWNKKMIPGESFNVGQHIAFYIENISKDDKHSQVQGTRIHPMFLKRLMEAEIREVIDGAVEIKAVSREPGVRAKVAVYSYDPAIDPIGACVGPNGQRIRSITNQLHGEKIDVVLWDEDKTKFIINAMSPVRVVSIELDEENDEVTLVVPDQQLSLAIGRHGITSKLVANLLGMKVNVVSVSDAPDYGIEILWNGDITEEELNSEEFKNAVSNRRRSERGKERRQSQTNYVMPKQEIEMEPDDEVDEAIYVQDTSIDEIQENLSAFEDLAESADETSDFNVDDLDEDYDHYYD